MNHPDFINKEKMLINPDSISLIDEQSKVRMSEEKFDALLEKMIPGDRHILAPKSRTSHNTFHA